MVSAGAAGIATRRVEFLSEADLVRGTLYVPAAPGPLPAVALAHGWGMVAGGDLEDYAQAIATKGIVCLTFDFRRLGASDGMPRQEIDPAWQIEDYRSAITFLTALPEVDSSRIGIWGSSYSGGHVLQVGATEARVKCVVSQVPTISGYTAGRRRVAPGNTAALQARFAEERRSRQAGNPPTMLRQVGVDGGSDIAYPGRESYDYMMAQAELCPLWQNAVTLRSLELARACEPGAWVSRIGPAALMMIVADEDVQTPTDLQLDAFNTAREPKELVLLRGGHYSAYTTHFELSSAAAARWFATHLT